MTTKPSRSGHLPINGLSLYHEVYGELGGSSTSPLLLIPGAFTAQLEHRQRVRRRRGDRAGSAAPVEHPPPRRGAGRSNSVGRGHDGIYSDPGHVLVDPDGSIHQQLALCFHAVPADPAGEQPRPDGTGTDAAGCWELAATADLAMHPAMRLRLLDAVTEPHGTHYD